MEQSSGHYIRRNRTARRIHQDRSALFSSCGSFYGIHFLWITVQVILFASKSFQELCVAAVSFICPGNRNRDREQKYSSA